MVVAYVYYIYYHRHCIDRDSLPSTSFKDGVFVMINIPNRVFDNEKNRSSQGCQPLKSLNVENIDRKGR